MDFRKGLLNAAAFTIGTAMITGEAIGRGAKSLYSTVVSDIEKVKEMKEIQKRCNALKESLNTRQCFYEEALDRELVKYRDISKALITKAQAAQKYMLYYNERIVDIKNLHRNDIRTKENVSLDGLDITKTSVGAGGIAGAAVGGGAVGLMAALGTASTGTAISSLSGAAFTNALLASLGGGSIASGGFGIAGGTVVLGSLIALPALAVGGYVADKKIAESYEQMKQCEAEANSLEAECGKMFATYDSVLSYMHVINSDFKRFLDIYTDIVDASVVVAVKDYIRSSYNKLLLKSHEAANAYLTIDLMKVKSAGKSLDDEIEQLKLKTYECRNELDALERYMTDGDREFISQMPFLDESNWEYQRKCYQDCIKKQWEELEQQKAEIKEKQNIISVQKREIEQYKGFVNKLQHSNIELQEKLNRTHDENEKLRLEKEEVEKICRDLKNKMPETFKDYLSKTKEKWHFIKTPKIIDSISSAEMLYSMYDKETFLGDYSAVVIQYVKSVEMLLVDVLRYNHIFHECDKNMMLKCLVEKYIMDSEMAVNWDYDVGNKINRIRKIRNNGAHKQPVNKEEMHETRDLVIGEDDNSNNKIGIVPYMNDLLR